MKSFLSILLLFKNKLFTICLFVFGFILVNTYAKKSDFIAFDTVFELDAEISVNDEDICINETATITFTASGGKAPYRFIYKIDGRVRPRVISESNSNSVTIEFEESSTGDYEFELISVKDNDNDDENSTTKEFTDKKITISVNAPPTVDFSFNNNLCANDNIQFTSTETGNADFTYLWEFGDGKTSTKKDPTHKFNTALGCGTADFNVKLTVTDRFGCSSSKTKKITVKEKPDISFSDAAFGGFSNCGNASPSNPDYAITVLNGSNTTCVSSYNIDWGDGTSQNNATFPASHTYAQIGVYKMKISGIGENGCINELTYDVKNVSNPAGGFESPGNTSNLCPVDSELTFGISNYELNSDDTTYTVNFGDGSSSVTFTQAEVENKNTIAHKYEKGSCGQFTNQFTASLTVRNACGTTRFTADNISILEASEPKFDIPDAACANKEIEFKNTSKIGDNLNCTKAANFRWDFGDGTIINDNGAFEPNNQLHTYTTPGTYTITLTASSRCGTDTITKDICIEPEITADFTVNNQEGCIPLNVVATNTTNQDQLCSAPKYKWEVLYTADNCGETISWEFANGTNETSENPNFLFKNPGKYLLTQTVITSCGEKTSTETIDVKKPPTVTIEPIEDFCGSATINPSATVENCTANTDGIIYNWSFTGANTLTANTLNPGNIVYNNPGVYEVTLEITNECGTSNKATQTFEIFEKPVLSNANTTQEICSGQNTSEITLNTGNANTTYSWTAVTTGAVSGFTSSGTSNKIPAEKLINSGNTIETVTYTVVPKIENCEGDAVDFVITVNPSPEITTQPISSEVCINGNATTLEVAYTNGIGAPTYQWFSNTNSANTGGNAIAGATSASFDPPTDTVGQVFYYAEIAFASGGCSKIVSDVASVTTNAQLTIDTPTSSQTLCVGGTANEFEVDFSGGAGNPSYQWFSNSVNTNTGGTIINGANQKTYTPPTFSSDGDFFYYVEVTLDGNGCSNANSNVFQVTVIPDPSIDSQPIVSQELCQGANPTDLAVSVSGGTTSDKTYQWFLNTNNTSAGGNPILGANTSTYTPNTDTVGTFYYYVVISQPESGCSVTSQTSTVNVNEAPIFTVQPNSSEICINGSASTLEVAYTNGTGVPTYQWFSNTNSANTGGNPIAGATNASFDPPTDTVGQVFYYAEITFSSGGCSKIVSEVGSVTTNAQLTIDTPASSQTLCIGGTANELEVDFSGGAGNPSYQWFSNSINTNTGGTIINGANQKTYIPPTFSSDGDFFYYVEVTLDGNGCSSANSNVFQVTVIPDPSIDSQPIVSQELCQGATPTDLAVSVSGGTTSNKTYQWFSNTNNTSTGGNLIPGANGSTYTPNTDTVGTFYYYVIISQPESGCSVTSQTSAINVNEAPVFTTQPTSSEICINESATTLEVAYTNGTGVPTYQWFSNTNNANTGGNVITGATNASFDPPTDTVGQVFYYAEITFSSGGCTKIISDVASVTVNQTPVISDAVITMYSEDTFSFNPNTIAGNSVPSGTKYTWSTPTFNPSDGIIGASAVTTPRDLISQTLENTGTSPIKVTYTITPATEKCEGNPFTLEVTVNPNISSNTIVNHISCFEANDGEISINVVGGVPFTNGNPYLISWSGPNQFTSSDTSLSNLEAGLYTLRIEDSTGFFIVEEWTVNQPDLLTIARDEVKNISCFQGNDGLIEVTISGGTEPYTYNWSTTDGSGIISGAKNQNTLTAGTYTLVVVDNNNCTTSDTFILTEPEGLQIETTSKQDILCFGDATGSIAINVTGGTKTEISPGIFDYNYSWSGPSGFSSNSKNIDNLIAGTYTVAVTDNLGCTTNSSIVVNQSPEIIVTYTTTDVSCYGEADGALDVNVSGGVAPYQISWSNFGNGFSQSNLTADTYIATITDGNNCVKEVAITINQPIFFIDPEVQPISCNNKNDGSIDLNLTGGIAPITVTWNDDPSAGVQRNNLAPGTYKVSIVDSDPKQCPIEQTFVFTNPPAIAVSSTVTDATDCEIVNSGSIDLTISGGTEPFEFTWNNGAKTEDLENIPKGDYSVEIKDANGCIVNRQFTIFRQDPIEIEFVESFITDCEAKTVSKKIEAKVSGGFLPHTLDWSSGDVSGANNQTIITNQPGTYVLSVTDNQGCVKTKSILVNDIPTIGNPDFRYRAFALENYDYLSINDPIQFTNLSSGSNQKVTWNFGDGSLLNNEENPVHTYDATGTYTVTLTVEYETGCTYTIERTVDITIGYRLINPTAFTPNGDGYNDTIRPNAIGFSEIEMNVYDTWGTLIYFEKGTSLQGWDGNIYDKPAENGNYIMVIKGVTFYDKDITITTPITLIK